MKLLTFNEGNLLKLGVRTEQGIVDIAAAAAAFNMDHIPLTIHEAIESGDEGMKALDQVVTKALATAGDRSAYVLDEAAIQWAPCVTNPNKIICIGLNYRKHAEETNAPIPEYPILFNKFNNTLTGHLHDIELPKASVKVDYEVELAIVMGKKAKYVSREDALNYVYGYCNANDLSARDLQLRTPQWLLGKTCDDFSPLGPYLVTADEVGDPNNLELKTIVNGEVRQNSHTSDMIFHCDEIISYISQHFTLEPGDIILTGTPAGVVLGYPLEKQVYLKDGDVVTIEIEKLGTLTNRMVAEQ